MKLALHLALGSVAVAVAHADDYAPSSGSGSDCSFVCSDLLQPVCGSDGMTYPNECFLSLADCNSPETITKTNDGACSTTETTSETSSTASSSYPTCSDVCPMIYKAVCGSDGVTYSNDCLLGVAQCQSGGTITKVSDGECPGSYPTTGSSEAGEAGSESTGCSEVCIEIWRPVCGSDGVTYANSCFLGIETCKNPGITQVSEGPCPTTGGSYGSNTDSSNESTPVDSETSSASSSTSCPDVCTDIYAPVCGSDGVTYSSECLLGVAQCKSDGSITKVSDGECPGSYPTTGSSEAGEAGSESTGCSEVCIEIWRPVCGSDAVTYANSCFLGIETCKNPGITQVSEGPCPTTGGSYGSTTNSTDSSEEATPVDSEASSASSSTSCPDVCTAIYAPVCGSDGVTYSSECRLDVACCKNPELHITKVHDGACSVECKTQL